MWHNYSHTYSGHTHPYSYSNRNLKPANRRHPNRHVLPYAFADTYCHCSSLYDRKRNRNGCIAGNFYPYAYHASQRHGDGVLCPVQ